MSVGYGGNAKMVVSDDSAVLYKYCCYDANKVNYEEDKTKVDGEIYIVRDAFVEPDIHEKIKRTPTGRKKTVTKRVKKDAIFKQIVDD